jgi:SAM-dependent methyltransferase
VAGAQIRCLACDRGSLEPFLDAGEVPVQVGVLWASREAARNCQRGAMHLAFCRSCGLVYNTAFDPTRVDYSLPYDNALHFSDVFRSYERRLADRLAGRYLRAAEADPPRVMELGCGSGHFLGLLCQQVGARGIGFDPSHDPARLDPIARGRVEILREPFSERAIGQRADLLCFRHVLEHIADPRPFLTTVRAVMQASPGSVVYCEVPNAFLALRQLSIWDLIYEHCSYFVPASLAALFAAQGFEVLEVNEDYGGQFVGLVARVAVGKPAAATGAAEALAQLAQDVETFASHFDRVRGEWSARLADLHARGRRVALWGAGAKTVGFCALLGRHADAVATVVDVNPGKQGTFLAGSGHEIQAPQSLRETPPDTVIVLNPLYEKEIRRDLEAMGLRPEVLSVS